MIKRTFDVMAALSGLIVALPLFILIPLLIKLGSPGPVFFRQTRMGKEFSLFQIWKFRTMNEDAPHKGGVLTVGQDPRITRIGRILREYKLDELPQLLNILVGDMSFVGPRPEVPKYVNKLKEKFEEVLTVKPGLTDLASIQYINEAKILEDSKNPDDDYLKRILPEKLHLAKLYIQQRSFLFDIAIILETILKIGGVKNAIFRRSLESRQEPLGSVELGNGKKMIVNFSTIGIVSLHLMLVIAANYMAFALKFDAQIPQVAITVFYNMLPWLLLLRGMAFIRFHLFQGIWKYASLWDLRNIVFAVVMSSVCFYFLVHWGFRNNNYPLSIFVVDTLILIVALGGIRIFQRVVSRLRLHLKDKYVLIVGAGDAGEMIVRDMKQHPTSHYAPVGFVDDDLSKVDLHIHGVKVLGTRDNLKEIFVQYRIDEVLVAIPGANSSTVREVVKSLEPFKVPIKTLPGIQELLDGKVTVNHIRDLNIQDLLERAPLGIQIDPVKEMIAGKCVMVTGAGGSIGSELCRQIVLLKPANLILFERYENSLYAIGNEIAAKNDSNTFHQVMGDITDRERVCRVMDQYRPDIVFHAAAHKHVPLMEYNPCEAIKNNILGTAIVASAAEQFQVEKFVLISTDKAVNPSSVMGATKRVAELVIQNLAKTGNTKFMTVRFGNVLGSNGSVVPRFLEQIKAGGPVTVTHPSIQRYFMLIPEAVHLVLQAATLGDQGGLYVLDMGGQIKLVDMARNLIRLAGYIPDEEIPIAFVGLRPGEKLYEELVGKSEIAEPSKVGGIFRVQVTSAPDLTLLSQKLLDFKRAAFSGESKVVIEQLRELIPSFQEGTVDPIKIGTNGINPSSEHFEDNLPMQKVR
jgi:FlaA1/EpsC-like NDP-sugar epimerase/lipopolysaccharide/colanic/teichoic acid biosynthesis glycosyltransferase